MNKYNIKSVWAKRLAVCALFIGFASVSAWAGTNDFVNCDAVAGTVSFNPGAFIAPLLNVMVSTITAAIPMAMLGWGVVVLFKSLGLIGKRK